MERRLGALTLSGGGALAADGGASRNRSESR